MIRLWFVRHGPTGIKAMVGWSDPPAILDDRPALDRLSSFLPDKASVVSSDLQRTVQTADAICNGRPRLPHDAGLREIYFGAWEMCDFAEIESKDPQRIRAFWERPGDIAPPDGESWNQTSQRVSVAVDKYVARGDRDLIIVCHFGAILSQLQRATGKSAYETFAQPIANLSVTRIDCTPEGWSAPLVNHLP
ncbi:histidine phosphatase family protein [Pelagovum sp. HNIBRBA483]|uniref:histidine phosphatase family protein n=1 Tax=Pelagovum sp. HNIBRBA483 TaxID=3233341 RepID=UPI0034A470D9